MLRTYGESDMAGIAKARIDKASEHPLWNWCVDMAGLNAAMVGTRDFVLSPTCSARFGLQVDPDFGISLGVPPEDMDAMMSVKWTSAALLRDYQGGNYLAVSTDNVSVTEDDKVPLRIFFPMSADKIAAFDVKDRPDKLRIRAMRIRRDGQPLLAIGPPRTEMKLVYQNFAKRKALA